MIYKVLPTLKIPSFFNIIASDSSVSVDGKAHFVIFYLLQNALSGDPKGSLWQNSAGKEIKPFSHKLGHSNYNLCVRGEEIQLSALV